MAWLEGNLYLASELGAYFLDLDDELRPFPLPNASNSAVYKFMSDSDGAHCGSRPMGDCCSVITQEIGNGLSQASSIKVFGLQIFSATIKITFGWQAFSEGLWLAHEGRIERHSAISNMTEAVMAISQAPDGKLWVANRSGVGYFDYNKNFVNKIPSNQFGRAAVHDLQFDGDRLYIATGRGVFYYENQSLYTVPGRALRDNPVFAISRSSKGGFWLGTGRGMYRLSYGGLTPFAYNAFLGSKFITYVLDEQNFGLIGTSKGAYYFTDRGIEKIGDQTSLESAYVTSILNIEGVGILIGSLNDGLFYRSTKGQWRQLMRQMVYLMALFLVLFTISN